ncbi:LOW QUALITY PROTEIN: myosin phosphatase Rho-interacting protein-like [Sardina pilchardus]|uniref:LOW QUALITY PROTEIN: myosin phosphatase Rho-interacting protein-like n=1 Tax=Sardina pilchardus TaxID=27697 RepID=UPI002E0E0F7D
MSTMKMDTFCNKFQANIFSKSKCQNCFKPRELHLRANEDLIQAKPIYGGWLCLAPEGTDFGKPAQRSRKWQRRFFILYEHGSLHFALDDSPSTLPQGTVNMNLCTDVVDAEMKTGQRNALCIVTPDQDFYIRGENKDIINGWNEQLVVYPTTNKHNRKKTTSKERPSVATQGPESVTPPGVTCGVAADSAQEEDRSPKGDSASGDKVTTVDPASHRNVHPATDSALHAKAGDAVSLLDSEVDANTQAGSGQRRPEEPEEAESERSEVWRAGAEVQVEGPISSSSSSEQARTGRPPQPTQKPKGPAVSPPPRSPKRRERSPDNRTSESVMTPDLLNFKKGWLMILEEQNQWKKNWFVLSTHKLRYYKDSVAEEASELVGEIDLTTCHQVTEHQIQRNYGFQIHTQTQVHTLAAMTAGIRRNWIQALAKNVRPSNAPDITNLSDDLCPFGSSAGPLPEPDLTRDSLSPEVSSKMRRGGKNRCGQKRREGAHGKPGGRASLRLARHSPPAGTHGGGQEQKVEVWSVERRRRRREERRKRYESVMGSVFKSACQEEVVRNGVVRGAGTGVPCVRQSSPEHQQQRAQEIEERWLEVEKAGIREERKVPLYPDTQARDVGELEKLLSNYQRRVEELTAQLTESSCHREEPTLDQQMSSTWDFQLESTDVQESEDIPVTMDSSSYSSHLSSLRDKYEETKELLRFEELRRQRMQEQLGFGSSILDQSSLALGDALTDDEQGSITSEAGCPELLKHLSFTSFEELHPPAVGQVRPRTNQGEVGEQDRSEVEERLVQVVASLTRENEALNQRSQEMVHQLTEADREIERLRAELDERQDGRPHLSTLEQLTDARVECLENELREKCLELKEAQAQLAAQNEKLRDTLRRLHLREATLEGLGFLEPKDHHSRAPVQEALQDLMEDQLDCAELCAKEAQEAQEALTAIMPCSQRDEVLQSQVLPEVQRAQSSESESEEKAGNGHGPEEDDTQHLVDELQTRSKALGKLLRATGETDLPALPPLVSERQDVDANRSISGRLRLEEEIWATLSLLKASPASCAEAGVSDGLTAKSSGAKLEEIKLYLSAHKHFSPPPINSPIVSAGPGACQPQTSDGSVLPESHVSGPATAEITDEMSERRAERILSSYRRLCNDGLWRELMESVNLKTSLLNCAASCLDSSANTELRSTVKDLCGVWRRQGDPELLHAHGAASELLSAYIVSRLEAAQEKCAQTEVGSWGGEESCQNCQVLRQMNEELCTRLSDIENQRSGGHFLNQKCPVDSRCSDGAHVDVVGQDGMENPARDCSTGQVKTERPTDLRADAVSIKGEEEKGYLTEVPDSESQREDEAVKGAPEPELVRPTSGDLAEPSRDECDGSMSALQEQHRRDLETLQAMCERGFEAMEEAHHRALAELRLQHQRELEQLQQDKEQLLEEEAAATLAAIEAVKRVHQEELEKVLQGRHLENGAAVNADVEEILKRHSEELCSTQRELDVLSQQYSLKCLESAHLAQALEAEHHALQQCQRRYQEISARHQELSGGLARENILPSSLSKEDPILQEKILYELHIGMRVKRAEVDCLKQEICSLKEELQMTQRDKRFATEKCTDMHKELSSTRVRAQRDVEELREHLRLVYKALEASSMEEQLDAGGND